MNKRWWEEEWLLDAEDPESGPVIGLKDGGVLFDCNDATRARGAHAAPDMARALLRVLQGNGHTAGCRGLLGCTTECAAIRAALTKAGVTLP